MTATEALKKEMDRLRSAMDHHAIVEDEVMQLRERVTELTKENNTLKRRLEQSHVTQ